MINTKVTTVSNLKLWSDLLYSMAVADAIGEPLEFKKNITIQEYMNSVNRDVLYFSDDTQMTLFCTEAIHTDKDFSTAYSRWYATQTNPEYVSSEHGGLLGMPCMYDVRAPGTTCLSAGLSLITGGPVVNNSKGNGTVMRCAPIALYAAQMGAGVVDAAALALSDAETTHKHPLAALSSMALTSILFDMYHGETLEAAVSLYIAETVGPISNLLASVKNEVVFRAIKLDAGAWVAEQAIALAVGCALHNNTFSGAVREAAMIDGDSDTVAIITAALMAAQGLPVTTSPYAHLVDRLAGKEAIDYVLTLCS